MGFISHLRVVSEADKTKAIEKLITDSTPDFDFFLMATLSVLMATFGLLLDSAAIVIGSMLIAPILYPTVSLGLGVSLSDYKLIGRSFSAVVKAMLLGIIGAVLVTLFANTGEYLTSEVVARTTPSLLYFVVAVISGIAVSYSLVKPKLSETLPGVAVSVALIPPLATVGVGIANVDWDVVAGSLVLFLVNIVGIIFAAMVSFSLMDVHGKRKVAASAIEKEERRVEREEKKIEKVEEADY
ncbi:MAG: TIGR00341 family protein [Candidatus Pacebacteria bacterium]|nr:TIGR00341 family protein [Candidatus Paceibacterota bacterium]